MSREAPAPFCEAALRSCAAGPAAATTGLPLLVGLGLAMAAIYGQVVIDDAMVARYVPARLRAKAFSVRCFLDFTASGLAGRSSRSCAPAAALTAVLGAAAAFGAVVFGCAAGFLAAASGRLGREQMPAE